MNTNPASPLVNPEATAQEIGANSVIVELLQQHSNPTSGDVQPLDEILDREIEEAKEYLNEKFSPFTAEFLFTSLCKYYNCLSSKENSVWMRNNILDSVRQLLTHFSQFKIETNSHEQVLRSIAAYRDLYYLIHLNEDGLENNPMISPSVILDIFLSNITKVLRHLFPLNVEKLEKEHAELVKRRQQGRSDEFGPIGAYKIRILPFLISIGDNIKHILKAIQDDSVRSKIIESSLGEDDIQILNQMIKL